MSGLLINPYVMAAAGGAPLEYVGAASSTVLASVATNTTLSLTGLTGGSDTAPAEGDIVIVVFGIGSNGVAGAAAIVTAGYTSVVTVVANDTADLNLLVAYKVMGPTPDTEVIVGPTLDTGDGGAVIAYVWRNVNTSTPMDVAYQSTSGTNNGVPNPAAITPTTAGAVVIAIGATAYTGAGSVSNGGDLSNFVAQSSTTGSYDCWMGIGSYAWTSGAFDPAAFGGGTTSGFACWGAVTLALRPA